MRMDKLTSKFQLALADAQSLAVGRDHSFIEPVHLMVAMLEQDNSTVRHLFTSTGCKVDLLLSRLLEELDVQEVGVLLARVVAVARMSGEARHRHALPNLHRRAEVLG